ncbi:CpsD/CapB family tyrosine-protein kinase [Aerococcus urinaeequi]|uniref:CpsD/CapB family tyrosine-protein kinase n=1 Tax=Aerococcus urinaeequi TaxID=51665 RepID=UPI003AAE6E06
MFDFKSKKKQQKLENEQKLGSPIVTHFEPMSAIAEQYKTIRTNIEFAQIGSSFKSIAVTSSIPMEGKSTTTVNLAYTYAQTGKKVLIVDADLRKPTLHKTFKLNNNVGLTTALVNDEYSLESAIQYSEDFDLYILPSGPIPPNPAELVGSQEFSALLDQITELFDLVIFDTPPLHSVTDGQIITSKVDGTILVVRQNYVRRDQVVEAKVSLDNVKANLIGYILNDVPINKNKGYGYYEYYAEQNH